MSAYEQAKDNIKQFLSRATDTNIHFMFFYGSDLTRPQIKSTFKSFKARNMYRFYLTPSVLEDGVYAYRETDLKYIVTLRNVTRSTPVVVHNASIVRSTKTPTPGEVVASKGDHLTFYVDEDRGKVLAYTHLTVYEEKPGFVFRRLQSSSCNFLVKPATTLREFAATYCDRPGRPRGLSMKDEYTGIEMCMLYDLSLVAQGENIPSSYFTGGKKPNAKGGRAPARYKRVQMLDSTFMSFLTEVILIPVGDISNDLESVAVVWDEYNTFGGANHFSIMYDHVTLRRIFKIDVNEALVASHVHHAMHLNAPVTAKEMAAYNKFAGME